MSRRLIRVTGIDAVATVAIAVLAGLWVVQAGPKPTGSTVIDVILVLLGSVLVVWSASSAPWWLGVVAAAVGAALSPSAIPLILAVLAVVGGLAVGVAKRSLPWSRALVAGASLQALARLGEIGRFGVSALIGIGLSLALMGFGIARRPRRERRWAVAAIGGLLMVMFLSLVGLAAAASSARPELENGNRVAREGIRQLAAGDVDAARDSFAAAAVIFGHADDSFGQPWSVPSQLVPGIAQNREAIDALVSGAASTTKVISSALGKIDFEALRPQNGHIDVDKVRSLEEPIQQLNSALDQLESTLVAISRDPWVVSPIASRVDSLETDVAKQRIRGVDALNVIKAAPAMLGADGKRVYFISFLTPAEARGGGGFMGNWAELTVDDGSFKMTAFGRHKDLNLQGDPSTRLISGPSNWVNHWGRYGLIRLDGFASYEVWSNVTMSPNFPDTAQVISELYPQSGGRKVDGVISLDVEALAGLLKIVGPIEVDGLDAPLTTDNAVDFLLKGQYLNEDNDTRIDTLERVAKTSVDTLFNSHLPSPPDLAAVLAPLAAEGHIKAWAVRPDEEQVFVHANMSGELPPTGDGDGFTFALTNGAGNKIDAYLEGDATYVVRTDPTTGNVTTTATLVLRNTAPDGLPDYVSGNLVGLPTGSDRTFVSLYSVLKPSSMTVDDEQVSFTSNGDDNFWVAGKFVDTAAHDSVKVTVEFSGRLDLSNGYHLAVRSPTLATPIPIRVVVDGEDEATVEDTRLHMLSVTR